MKIRELTDKEKEFLNALGTHPNMPLKDLVAYTPYKRVSSIVRKLEEVRTQHIVRGPLYETNLGKLCKNPLHKLFCILETDQSYDKVISYVTLIDSLTWVYTVLSPHKKLLNVGVLSSDDQKVISLFQVLKDNNIITNYRIHVYNHKRLLKTPNFFGDLNPCLDNLLDLCELPDLSLEHHNTDWNACDISILPYFEEGYKGAKLIEILKAEKKLNKPWTYDQIKYSYRKMVKNELIKKRYVIFPFPLYQCSVFNLLLKTDDIAVTQRVLYNFARKQRVYKECFFCKKWGVIHSICYPPFLADLMYKLDKVDEITEKELYQIRSISGDSAFDVPSRFYYYNIDEQTLKYPYNVYKERIKEKIENEQ